MKRTVKSFGNAIQGLSHAIRYETNLRRFILGHCVVLCAGILLQIHPFTLITVTLAAAFFVVVELLNTAIERVTDTFDDHLKTARGGHEHPGVGLAKDVGSAAALIALIIYGVVLALTLVPYVLFALMSA